MFGHSAILPELPSLKSDSDLAGLRAAARVNARAHRLAAGMVMAGVTPLEIDAAVAGCYRAAEAEPLFLGVPGFHEELYPAVSCISVNDAAAHGLPDDRPFRDGDVVTIDLGCRSEGWCADSAATFVVGRGTAAARRLVDATREALHRAIAEIPRCDTWSEVLDRVEPFVARAGLRNVDQVFGHGIGREMHEPPQVPFSRGAVGGTFVDFDLRPGLVFTIEPLLTPGVGTVRLADDQWTLVTSDGRLASHFEEMVAITERGVEVLSAT